jgi:hypothetical protein
MVKWGCRTARWDYRMGM